LKSLTKITAESFLLLFLFSAVLHAQEDTITAQKSDTAFVMQKSPLLAVLQSAIIPGLGQIYNESYFKAPVIWGITGMLVYGWIHNDDQYSNYRSLAIQNPDQYIRYRDFYRDQRDLFAIYIGVVYFLNLVDAYVDAQLFDFNVEEDFFTKTPMLKLKVNF